MRQGWIKNKYGNKIHYVDDRIHREGGPAEITTLGTHVWFKQGKRHREDGPAYIIYDGGQEWWYEGEFLVYSWMGYTQEKFEQWKRFKAFL